MNRVNSTIVLCAALFLFSESASGTILKKTESALWPKAKRILMPFVENKGQIEDPDVLFYSNTFACKVLVNRDGTIGYLLPEKPTGKVNRPLIIRERFGSLLKTPPRGERKSAAKVNYFRGKDPKKWAREIATFNAVDMGDVYEGIRLKLQARGNNVEKIFHVRPAGDPSNIHLRIEGARHLKLTPKGELEINTGASRLRFSKPVAFQHINGRKKTVDVAYTVKGNAYGFRVAAYDKTKELIIDPLIAVIFQGTSKTTSRPMCMATNDQGDIYVAGRSADQLAVFKFDSKLEELKTAALFGPSRRGHGSIRANVNDIAVDSQGAVYLAGGTRDENFPVTAGAFDTEYTLSKSAFLDLDGFIIKYNAALNNILAATYIGAGYTDTVYGLALDPTDNVYVVGSTSNPVSPRSIDTEPFPTTEGAYDRAPGAFGNTKAFIARLDSNLQNLLASTLLGHTGDPDQENDRLDDIAYDVAIDADGNIVVAGATQSNNFPITGNCADALFQGKWEGFVSKFDPALQNLLASTLLGGANDEKINVVKIDPNNDIVVAGWTLSSDFPVSQDSFDTSYNVYEDGFVTRLNNDLSTLSASTFIGGTGTEQVSDMAILEDGRVVVCGGTGSVDFPVTKDGLDPIFNGSLTDDFYKGDGFYTILDQSLKRCEKSTFIGGQSSDHASAVLLNNGDIVLAGETFSENFPNMREVKGDSDAFVCRFNDHEPPLRPLSGRPGHWQSKDSGTAHNIYLDIDICNDGSFKGIYRGYACVSYHLCILSDTAFPPEPINGTFNFEKKTGTITTSEECKDLPLEIMNQSPDKLHVSINPDGQTDKCFNAFEFHLNYQGESDSGTCNNVDDDDDSDNDGGGGGCFIRLTGVMD